LQFCYPCNRSIPKISKEAGSESEGRCEGMEIRPEDSRRNSQPSHTTFARIIGQGRIM